MRGNATANTPVTGQRPSHKMDFMTPIDLSLPLFDVVVLPPFLFPPPFQWTTADAYICLYLSRDHFSSPLRSGKLGTNQGQNIIRLYIRMYLLRKKFWIPFPCLSPFRSFIRLPQTTYISGILRRLRFSAYRFSIACHAVVKIEKRAYIAMS